MVSAFCDLCRRQLVCAGMGQLQKRRVGEDFIELPDVPGVTLPQDFDRMGLHRSGCGHFL